MSTPISSRAAAALVAVLLLAACNRSPAGSGAPDVAAKTDPNRVECAPAGAAAFERVCTVDRVRGANGLVLTLSAPDGAFRRLLVTGDGRGLVALDGAQPAHIQVIGPALVEVSVGRDRYRLPAHLKGSAPANPR